MSKKNLFIKGMVCERCISSVSEAFKELGIEVSQVSLGEVVLQSPATFDESKIEHRLSSLGFSLIKDKNLMLVHRVKDLVKVVYSGYFDFPYNFRFFHYTEHLLQVRQDTISEIFLEAEGQTLEKYIIDFRINKVKELLVQTDKTVADISFALGFSSTAHLSKQFKGQTGLTPSGFRESGMMKP